MELLKSEEYEIIHPENPDIKIYAFKQGDNSLVILFSTSRKDWYRKIQYHDQEIIDCGSDNISDLKKYFDDSNEQLKKEDIVEDIKFLLNPILQLYKYEQIMSNADDIYSDYIAYKSKIRETPIVINFFEKLKKEKNAEFYDCVDKIKKITDFIYPETSYFEEIIDSTGKYLNVYILFPEVEISNTIHKKHIIKDLVVKIPFKYHTDTNTLKVSGTIQGTRLTLGNIENNCGYLHSHLPARHEIHFNNFCLGSTDVANMNLDLMLKFDESKYELFLHMLPNYVNHESLSGGPYIKIQDITLRQRNFVFDVNALSSTLDIFCTTIDESDYDLSYKDDFKITVLPRLSLSTKIMQYLQSRGFAKNKYMCSNVNGVEYKISSDSVPNIGRRLVSSSEVKKVEKIIGVKLSLYDDYDNNNNSSVLSKSVIDYVTNKIEKEINEYYKTEYIT